MLMALLISVHLASASTLRTNEVIIENSPGWLKSPRVEKVTQRIQRKLEWATRRVNVTWFTSKSEYEASHNLGPSAIAVTKYSNGQASILLGPNVTTHNFDAVFGHELVHVIIYQKYKSAIPKWFEEGLANHLANMGSVNYEWLARQPMVENVKELAHPQSGSSERITYRYKASQALAEMLDKKCKLDNLIRLSVERKMEDYIVSYCQIKDLNQAFRDWIKLKAPTKS
jgi:hypothetical protein